MVNEGKIRFCTASFGSAPNKVYKIVIIKPAPPTALPQIPAKNGNTMIKNLSNIFPLGLNITSKNNPINITLMRVINNVSLRLLNKQEVKTTVTDDSAVIKKSFLPKDGNFLSCTKAIKLKATKITALVRTSIKTSFILKFRINNEGIKIKPFPPVIATNPDNKVTINTIININHPSKKQI